MVFFLISKVILELKLTADVSKRWCDKTFIKISIQSAWADCCIRWFKHFSVSETDSAPFISALTLLNAHNVCQVISKPWWWRWIQSLQWWWWWCIWNVWWNCKPKNTLYWILSLRMLQDKCLNWTNFITGMKISGI